MQGRPLDAQQQQPREHHCEPKGAKLEQAGQHDDLEALCIMVPAPAQGGQPQIRLPDAHARECLMSMDQQAISGWPISSTCAACL